MDNSQSPLGEVSRPSPSTRLRHRRGLTLFELMIVLGILLILGTLVVPAISSHMTQSREDVTLQSMRRVREVVMSTYFDDMGEQLPRPGTAGLDVGRADHPQLCYLFVNPEKYEDGNNLTEDYDITFDPVTRQGWRGPYLLHEGGGFRYFVDADRTEPGNFTQLYGETDDPTILDGWGNPIVIQEPDADGDNVIDFDEARRVRLVSAGPNGVIDTDPDDLLATDRGDDLVLFLRVAEY